MPRTAAVMAATRAFSWLATYPPKHPASAAAEYSAPALTLEVAVDSSGQRRARTIRAAIMLAARLRMDALELISASGSEHQRAIARNRSDMIDAAALARGVTAAIELAS